MYLSMLSTEQKKLFLDLAYGLASIDGDYSLSEKKMIAAYCDEMKIEFDEGAERKPIDEIIDLMSSLYNIHEKKIVVFELIGLAMSDNNYDESERALINNMLDKFKLKHSFADECENIINEYIVFQNKINKIVLE